MDFNDLKGLFAEVKSAWTARSIVCARNGGRAHRPRNVRALLDGVQVEAYGTQDATQPGCGLSVPEPTLIVAQPFDPSLMTAIEKAIRFVGPRSQSRERRQDRAHSYSIATDERRKELSRHVHRQAEEGRNAVAAGAARRQRAAEEAVEGFQDLRRRRARGLDEVQKITDQHVKMIDELQKKKDQDLLGQVSHASARCPRRHGCGGG